MWVQASPVLGGESQGQRVLQTGPRCQDLPVPYSHQIDLALTQEYFRKGGERGRFEANVENLDSC